MLGAPRVIILLNTVIQYLCPIFIQNSSCARIVVTLIAYYRCTSDDLCRKLDPIFHDSVKGVE